MTKVMKGDFLPLGYEVPKKSKQFMKLVQGKNKIRILSNPILFWEIFVDDNGIIKPLRFPFDTPPTDEDLKGYVISKNDKQEASKLKHCWAFFVYDYADGKFKCLNISQQTIQEEIKASYDHEDFGDPKTYDITITRTGTSMNDTGYKLIASPPKALNDKVVNLWLAFTESTNANINNLLEGDYPFENYA